MEKPVRARCLVNSVVLRSVLGCDWWAAGAWRGGGEGRRSSFRFFCKVAPVAVRCLNFIQNSFVRLCCDSCQYQHSFLKKAYQSWLIFV